MKIYFASASANWPEVRKWMNLARVRGHEITFDWTTMVEQHGRGEPLSTKHAILKEAAHKDRAGVYDCDVLINLWTNDQCGALLETGMAIAHGKWVLIAANSMLDIRYSVFWELNQIEQISLSQLDTRLKDPSWKL